LFSSRSSWEDVKEAKPLGPEYLHIVTKTGRDWNVKQPTVSEDSIRFGTTDIPKSDIRYVSYVRVTPLTEWEEYITREDVSFLAPRLWFGSRFSEKLSVLIYNSDRPEDNVPVQCKPS
jgi:hypothetical protein